MNAPSPLLDAGYFAKRIEQKPDAFNAPAVREICSVSNCISSGPENWIELWLHNDFGWFNRIADALRVVPVGLEPDYRLFAYRIHPEVFTTAGRVPLNRPGEVRPGEVRPGEVRPEPIGHEFLTLGFDVASRRDGVTLGFECCPLSCNLMCQEIRVNEFCLLSQLDDAIAVAERFAAEQPEPGDYYVIEVLERTAVK